MMNGFKKFSEELEERFMSHISPEIRARVESGLPVTWTEYENLRGNSYERKVLYPLLDDEALVNLTELCLKNSSCGRLGRFSLAKHYDEALIGEMLPMLLDRFKKRTEVPDAGKS